MRALVLAGACWALPQQRVSSFSQPTQSGLLHFVSFPLGADWSGPEGLHKPSLG